MELTLAGARCIPDSLGVPSTAMLLLAATGPAPLSTGAVRGLSTLRMASSFSLLTILLAWLAEKMPWLSLEGGGEVAVGERRRWIDSRSRVRAMWR